MIGPPIVAFMLFDLRALLSSFFSQQNLSYAQFKRTWRKMSTSHLHHVVPSGVDVDAFYQLSFDLILRMLHVVDPPLQIVELQINNGEESVAASSLSSSNGSSSTSRANNSSSSSSSGAGSSELQFAHLNRVNDSEGRTILWNVGVIYALYTFYATQIHASKSLINISPEYYSSLRMAVEQITWLGEIGDSAVQIFNHMIKEELLVFGLCMGPVTPWGAQRWEKLTPLTVAQLSEAIKLDKTLSAKKASSQSSNFVRRLKSEFESFFEESRERVIPIEENEQGQDEEKYGGGQVDSATSSAAGLLSSGVTDKANKKAEKKMKKKEKTSLNVRDTMTAVMGMRSGMRLSSTSSSSSSAKPKPSSAANVAPPGLSQNQATRGSSDQNNTVREDEEDEDEYTDDSDSSEGSGQNERTEYVSAQEQKRRRLGEHYKKLDQNEL